MSSVGTWYHAHQDSVKRSEGKSAVGLVSYITGERLKDERTGEWKNRNHPGEVLAWGTVAPLDAPAYFTDPNQLSKTWNDVERSETRKNSIVAVHWNVAGSRDHSEDDHRLVARAIAEGFAKRYGVIVTYGIHRPTDHGDDRNWHYHFGHNMRRVGPLGIGEKAREIIAKATFVEETTACRAMIASVLNEHLARIGSPERVSHLSYAEREVAKEPTKHLGNKQTQAELKGIPTPTGDENRDIKKRNGEYETQQNQRAEARQKIEAEIFDLVAARLQQILEGTRPVEVSDQQFNQRDEQLKTLLEQVGQQRNSLAQFDKDYEEEQKRIALLTNSREEEIETRKNRGDIPDASDRWASAMHKAYNPRVRPEESMALAVGYEAEEFRREQKDMRAAEAKETDPAKLKLLVYSRQIAACDYMGLGAEKCAAISAALLGRPDNEISNRDRDRATDWHSIGEKLRDERTQLRDVVNQNLHEEIEAFLKGHEQTPKAKERQPREPRDEGRGVSEEPRSRMARDLPPKREEEEKPTRVPVKESDEATMERWRGEHQESEQRIADRGKAGGMSL